ncbi:MAG: hypothetical protein R3E39_06905 [Anaerolineae bacterium]
MDLIKFESSKNWLRYIENGEKDLGWLASHEETIFAVIQQDLYRDSEFHRAFDLVQIVFPYFGIVLEHLDMWTPILMETLIQAQGLSDNDRQARILRWVGEAYLKTGQQRSSHNAFTTALDRAKEGKIDEMMLAAYTGLIKLQWFDLRQPLTKEIVQQALGVAQRLDDLGLRGDLYEALALANAHIGNIPIALEQGQMAYIYWNKLNNPEGLGRAAFTLAEVYRYAARDDNSTGYLQHALDILEIARSNMAETDYAWQYPMIAYVEGSIYFQLGMWNEAESAYEISLDEATRMNRVQSVVVARHGLGLVQTQKGNFEIARGNLLLARELWKKLNNMFEETNVLFALANLEVKVSNYEFARNYLLTALGNCDQLGDFPDSIFLRTQLQAMLDNLPPAP